MKGDKIYYKKGYKHQLVEDYRVFVGIIPDKFDVDTPFLKLDRNGYLTVKAGYAWDGASGPTLDTPSVKRASLVHDALYQLMREEKISLLNREKTDSLLRDIMKEDGANTIRAWLWYKAVQWAALKSATCEGERPVITAP
jgi:hypothetical protein